MKLDLRMRPFLKGVVDYRSRQKISLDRYLDPALFAIGVNGSYLAIADQVLDVISKRVDGEGGGAMLMGYVGLAAGGVLLNEHVVLPLARRIKQQHQDRLRANKTATALSWVRTAAQVGILLGAYAALDIDEAFSNIRYDAETAFSRRRAAATALREGEGDATSPQLTDELQERVLPEYPVRHNGDPMYTGGLEGRTFTGLFSEYTGISGTVPRQVNVDFAKQLAEMWERKRRRANNATTDQTAHEILNEYRTHKPTTMTLDDYVDQANTAMREVSNNLDWAKVRRMKGLSEAEGNLLREISTALNANDLIAYGMTELMPGRDGQLNAATLDFLLRNAGREYVESIPAMYDGKTSFGLYQFTEYALFEHKGDRRGASVINAALPESLRIRDSVRYLRGNDHHKAAYLFAISNLADLIGDLNRHEMGVLEDRWHQERADTVEYIATAHHLPVAARHAGRRWLSNNAAADFVVSCDRSIRDYAVKSQENRKAMYAGVQRVPEPTTNNGPLFEDLHKVNSHGRHVFRYTIKSGDTLNTIAERFNAWDMQNGDRWITIENNDIVRKDGAYVRRQIQPGQQVYITAQRR